MTDDAPTTEPHPAGQLPDTGVPAPIRRRRRISPVTVVLVVLLVGLIVAARVNLDYYAIQPGTAQPVQPFITVPTGRGHPVARPVLLTDVDVTRVTALSYLYFRLQSNTDIQPIVNVIGGTPPSEFDAQGTVEMDQAEAAALTAGLRRLGYTVATRPVGAVVFTVWPGTPAWGKLSVGDVITAVDGVATPNASALTTLLRHYHSGQTVTLSVLRGGTGKAVPVAVTLHTSVVDLGPDASGRPVHATVDLGIEPQDQVAHTYPFPVSIDVTGIGGPSAGLAMTLGVIDALSGGNLTGSTRVAATGTMDDNGNVGDVGGVPQKTVAVERAGARIFLVPPQEYRAAESKATGGLQVYAVSTLDQALAVIAAHGGHVPAPGSSHASTTAAA
jgi:PDZ domain-containing protein